MKKDKKISIDVGSSTVKVYEVVGDNVNLILGRGMVFKDGFDTNKGIAQAKKDELFKLIELIKDQNQGVEIKILATAVFRKLAPNAKATWVDEFRRRTGLFFNIIDQDLENYYLELALIGKCKLDEAVLLINIGGGSTELVVMRGEEAIEKQNIDLGAGTVMSQYVDINLSAGGVKLEEVVCWVKEKLPPMRNKCTKTFYTGGELTYMKLVGYKLKKNTLFADEDHPWVISHEDFKRRNVEIFEKVRLEDLEKLMPDNPSWMRGARSCCAIAQAICENYDIQLIIPSNSNLINGVTRHEAGKIGKKVGIVAI